jgi:predicted RNase H-like HicB family nuclease
LIEYGELSLTVVEVGVKKSLELDYPRPEAVAFRPIHGFATTISKTFFRQNQKTLTTPIGRGFSRPNKHPVRRKHSKRLCVLVFCWRTWYSTVDARNHRVRGKLPMKQFKIVVEKHPDTYVAYPLGLKGVVVGQGDTYEAALADVKSAIRFHIETFGPETLEIDPPILEAFIAEAGVPV